MLFTKVCQFCRLTLNNLCQREVRNIGVQTLPDSIHSEDTDEYLEDTAPSSPATQSEGEEPVEQGVDVEQEQQDPVEQEVCVLCYWYSLCQNKLCVND